MRKLNPDMVRWIFMSLMIILFIVTGISGLDWQYSLTGAVGFTWIIFEMMMLNQIGRSIHGMLAYLMRPVPQKPANPEQFPSHKAIKEPVRQLKAEIFPIDEGRKA